MDNVRLLFVMERVELDVGNMLINFLFEMYKDRYSSNNKFGLSSNTLLTVFTSYSSSSITISQAKQCLVDTALPPQGQFYMALTSQTNEQRCH